MKSNQLFSLYAIATLYIVFCSNVHGVTESSTNSPYDLTIVGQLKYRDSLGRFPITFANLFKNDLFINFISSGTTDFQDIPHDLQKILSNPNKTAGKVAILFDILWDEKRNPSNFVPQQSLIKIAYSMLESSAIPPRWVTILNKKFDLVVVPDEYYKAVYRDCGVTIPIFVQPHGIDIEEFLSTPIRPYKSGPFVFGSTGTFMKRKNHELLIEAFHKEFGNDPSVYLKIHGRVNWFNEFDLKGVLKKINPGLMRRKKKLSQGSNKLTSNIELILSPLSPKQYKEFFSSLDCYVLLSKGEGFSITPREALAFGKPCIISHNTAHETIAETGYVYPVRSEIAEPAFYAVFKGQMGYNFNCKLSDARKALREVYNNYPLYVEKAVAGRKWVESYLWKNVKAEFLNLIKPTKVILGDENKVTDEFIMTTSTSLYRKYLSMQKESAS